MKKNYIYYILIGVFIIGIIFYLYKFNYSSSETFQEDLNYNAIYNKIPEYPKKLKICHGGYNNDYPPYYSVSENGKVTGYYPEIIKNVMKRMEIEIEFCSMPWSRALNSMKYGTVDAIMVIMYTDERANYVLYPEKALGFEANTLFTLENRKDISYEGRLRNIDNLKVGKIKEYSYGTMFDKFVFKNLREARSEAELIDLLLNKNIDVAIGNKLVISYLCKKRGVLNKIRFLEPVVSIDPAYTAFSKVSVDPQFVQDFSKIFADFEETEEYKKILKKYNVE